MSDENKSGILSRARIALFRWVDIWRSASDGSEQRKIAVRNISLVAKIIGRQERD